ncbi:MAG TPA: zf-HC2 domain-containing protein [Blastocatellia bacterium]|nr:zf-HC2 domain-containing protein [Blastocatellia bacterium]
MNCRRIEKLIPLYVEGDLGTDEASRVLAHSKTCCKCQELISEYEASQEWLRSPGPPEFEDALFDDITRGVMKEINQRRRSSLMEFFAPRGTLYRAYAAAAALLIIFAALAFYFYPGKPDDSPQRDRIASGPPAPDVGPAPEDVKQAPGAIHVGSRRRFKRHARERISRPQSDNVVARERKNELAEPATGAETKTVEMMRIEFQTNDPNIRIIWLSPEETDSQSFKPMTETD